MLTEALMAVSGAGGAAVVQAAGTDAWTGLRQRVARLLGRGDTQRERAELERLDRTAQTLEEADAAGNAEHARLQCEFLRQEVSVLPVGLPVTVSIGVAEFRRRDDTTQQVFKRADEALYAAKRAGRDRVEVAP
jgi:predicted signal transduction protein with EAL and GGDEF domain